MCFLVAGMYIVLHSSKPTKSWLENGPFELSRCISYIKMGDLPAIAMLVVRLPEGLRCVCVFFREIQKPRNLWGFNACLPQRTSNLQWRSTSRGAGAVGNTHDEFSFRRRRRRRSKRRRSTLHDLNFFNKKTPEGDGSLLPLSFRIVHFY